jgi:PAS domain S-box-containing protein
VSHESSSSVNILLVDDQPAKLLSYEVILSGLGETLIKAGSARQALEYLLKTDIAVILLDVSMPELDGFELAKMIREHPRFRQIAIIFVSAIQVSDFDSLRGYEAGAVDYVPVPVVPELLRAKVRIFVDLYRKTRELERLNQELEGRVAARTAELQASAARLRDSEQRRTVALAAGQMGSWEWDRTGGAVTWDAGQYRIFGMEPDGAPIAPQTIRAMIHPEDWERVSASLLPGVLRTGRYQTELRILRHGGDVGWCICAAAGTVAADGSVERLSGVTLDITERKRAEESLRQLNDELEQRIEDRTREREVALAQLFEAQKIDTIGQLTGGVAHDFNNLLMAVLGSLELLKKRLPDDARSLRLLNNAVQGAERGAALTQRLLAFARRQELKPQSIDVAKLVNGMEDLLQRAVGPGVVIIKLVPATLPLVKVDGNQLELAILNLAVNARDALPAGGSLSIRASDYPVSAGQADAPRELAPGTYIRLEVIDTGVGMDEATLARATEPFFTTKGPGKGTGLGLSMVQGLAVQSGGAMTVTSVVGRGTTISLWLPQVEHDGEVANVDQRRLEVPASLPVGVALTVLVVDDDALVCTGTAAMLEDLGHRVIEANSAARALDLLQRHASEVHVVLTDHAMPGLTGMELIQLIRVRHPQIGVILASGYAEIEAAVDQSELLRLPKPFQQSDLKAALAAALNIPGPGQARLTKPDRAVIA